MPDRIRYIVAKDTRELRYENARAKTRRPRSPVLPSSPLLRNLADYARERVCFEVYLTSSTIHTRLSIRFVYARLRSCNATRRMANYVETSNEPNKVELDLRELLAATAGRWTGCDWITSYGPKKLNLQGLRSRQASRISDYTSAEESVFWAEAAGYLEQIEQDAANAEMLAKRAVTLLLDGRDAEALESIDLAVVIEARSREPIVWRRLQDAVRAQGFRGAKSF